ncbi:hypothetical protein B0A50_02105 [Salinomyces thailandicus]|uniref:Uncharacterized protein n=1 Tax=Salinomyces thailandicus TaxID=706561 RepID=A0A4U0U9K0_9PEZI|nr:hypothetical protein B0A50_02105 [Salinomyces thailandica]
MDDAAYFAGRPSRYARQSRRPRDFHGDASTFGDLRADVYAETPRQQGRSERSEPPARRAGDRRGTGGRRTHRFAGFDLSDDDPDDGPSLFDRVFVQIEEARQARHDRRGQRSRGVDVDDGPYEVMGRDDRGDRYGGMRGRDDGLFDMSGLGGPGGSRRGGMGGMDIGMGNGLGGHLRGGSGGGMRGGCDDLGGRAGGYPHAMYEDELGGGRSDDPYGLYGGGMGSYGGGMRGFSGGMGRLGDFDELCGTGSDHGYGGLDDLHGRGIGRGFGYGDLDDDQYVGSLGFECGHDHLHNLYRGNLGRDYGYGGLDDPYGGGHGGGLGCGVGSGYESGDPYCGEYN